jgi:thiamine monophosphate synthase
MPKLPLPTLLLLTDRTLLTPNWTLAQSIAPCITGGVNMVVFREDDLPDKPRLILSDFAKDGVAGRVPYLVSGGPEFALKAGADGLQIEPCRDGSRTDQSPVLAARHLLEPDRILGVAISSLDSLKSCQAEGVGYALLHLDWTNPEPALGMLERYCQTASIPIIAGLDMPAECAGKCIRVGAAGVAICKVGMASYNRTDASSQYVIAMNTVLDKHK